MKKLLLRAPLLSKSGYGVHSRQVFKYLLSRSDIAVYTQPVPWGITPWSVNSNDENGLIGEALKRSVNGTNEKYDFSVQIQLPNEWDASLAKTNIGITAAVETTKSNPIWTSVHCSKMDLIIVPSEHTKSSLTKSSFTTTPIFVVPETYHEELEGHNSGLKLNLRTKFNFLTIGVLTGMSPETDRKNVFYMIKWFVEAFKGNNEVGLIIKTNRGRDTTTDRKMTFKVLKKVLREIGHDPNKDPAIYLLHGSMTTKEIADLYNTDQIKAFVSCTRGEGFGLPFLEAAVSGLPVMATNWSAYTEFMNLGKWISFDYNLRNIAKDRVDDNIFMSDSQWAEVDETDFKQKMKRFYHKPSLPKTWALDLSAKLKSEYSWKALTKKYDAAFSEIL